MVYRRYQMSYMQCIYIKIKKIKSIYNPYKLQCNKPKWKKMSIYEKIVYLNFFPYTYVYINKYNRTIHIRRKKCY